MSNITKIFVEKIAVPKKILAGRTEQKRYYDAKLKGFGVRVTSGGCKAFFVEKFVNGNLKRITLGHYPEITSEQARKEAQIMLGKIATGIDPIAEKKAKKTKKITLAQAFDDYLVARKSLKPTTAIDYRRVLNEVIPDWIDKPLTNITLDMISKKHIQHGENNSKARSNYAMRVLRAIFNFAINQYQVYDGKRIILENPVKRLSHTRAWYRIPRRQNVIKQHQLAAWYKGLMDLSQHLGVGNAQTWQDYFLLVLFTGMRRSEAATLRWSDVDLKAKTITLQDTKNRNSHVLPLSDFLYDLFLRRGKTRQNEFVFPSDNSNSGHIVEPRKAQMKIIESSEVAFDIHSLRRSFITIAEGLDIPAYALKRLLNHKMNNDITAGYIIADVERLRKPMQQITDHLLKCMGVHKPEFLTNEPTK